MARCIRCGKRGLFLAVDSADVCDDCRKKEEFVKQCHKHAPWNMHPMPTATSTEPRVIPTPETSPATENERLSRENERLARENERLSRRVAEMQSQICDSDTANGKGYYRREENVRTPRHKTGCLTRLLYFLVLLTAVLLVVLAKVSHDSDLKRPSIPSTTSIPTASSPAPTAKTANSAPGIAGSNAYDAIGSLRDMGYKVERRQARAGYLWEFSDTVDGVYISMDLTANKDYEICAASFIMNYGDNGFLYFGSTLPYDAANKALTAELIQSDVEKTITIGDAIWTIHQLPYGKWLHVIHPDYEDWIINNLPLE